MTEAQASIAEISADRLSGAAEIAGRAAHALASTPPELRRGAIEMLLTAHPSMAPLWRLATALLDDPSAGAARFLADLAADRRSAAALAAALPDSVLTISWSSTLVEALRLRRPSALVCMRSEPGGEGARTAAALAEVGDTRLLDDDEALRSLPAEAVVVGADALAPTHLVNKVKTRALCEAAAVRGVPRYAAAGGTKLLAAELPLQGPFELVPLRLLTAVAMPDGLTSPGEAGAAAARTQLHRSLVPLLEELGGIAAVP